MLIKINRLKALLLCLLAGIEGLSAQTLQDYLREGIQQNLLLKQRNLSLEKALNALDIAKTMYLPSVDFQTVYTTAAGGRSIPLPIGDLMNPVYSTLNQLTQSQLFPQINNQTINFLPKNYYDARIRTTVPLINSNIGYNKKIQEQQVVWKEQDIDLYKRELIKSIKEAYYQYATAVEAKGIYQEALVLAQEGRRVNEKLLESGKGLPAYVVRADNEIAQVKAKINEYEMQEVNAKAYFNVLLNREAMAAIQLPALTEEDLYKSAELLYANELILENREELKQLNTVAEIGNTAKKMYQKFYVPQLSAFGDLGSQAEGLKFNKQSRYFMVGLQLDVPIFHGNRNKLKIKEADISLRETKVQLAYVTQQIQLGAAVAKNNYRVAQENYKAAISQQNTADTYQRLIQKGYTAGTNTYIETVDARTQWISAGINVTIGKYQVLMAAVRLERELATYNLNTIK